MSGKQIRFISVLIISLLALTLPTAALADSHLAAEGTETTETSVSAEATTSQDPIVTKTDVDQVGTPLDSLNVSYWPEYDDPSVLVMYRGTVDSSIKTPSTLRIAIPRGTDVRLVATSAIDPNGQFQYDTAWNSKQLVDGGDKTILTYELIHPTFQFEIYLQPVSGKGKRDFDFKLPIISEIKNLSVDIKKPVRAENFVAKPAAARTTQEGQFEDHLYSFTNVGAGQQYAFNVTYNRADSKPSIDKTTGVVDTSGGSQQTALIVIFVVLLIGAAVTMGVVRMRNAPMTASRAKPVKSKSGTKSKPGSKKKSGSKSSGSGKPKASPNKKFCSECGEQVKAGSKFCPECGQDL